MRSPHYLSLCLAVLALCSCNNNMRSSDADEEKEPLVKAGQAYMEQEQWDAAEQAFKQALEKDPSMARPHLDLALIYQQYKPNYVHAIYHYDRYLELRPDSEKAEFIKEQRDKVAETMAVFIIQNSPQVKQVVTELNRLKRENATLKQQLAAAQVAKTATENSSKAVAQTTSDTTIPPQISQPAVTNQIYNVVSGDTLSKIATKFYGNPAKWNSIFEANKDTLSSPDDLRAGQTLVIPPAEQ